MSMPKKNRQHNGQKHKRTNNDIQNKHQQTSLYGIIPVCSCCWNYPPKILYPP